MQTAAESIEQTVDMVLGSLLASNPHIAHLDFNAPPENDSDEDLAMKTLLLQMANTIISDVVANRLAAVHRQMNTLVPISRLPVEILAEIFIWRQLSVSQGSYWHSLQRLRRTSVVWRDVIDNCPKLWTLIHGKFPARHVMACINRSGNLPLTIADYQWNLKPQCDGVLLQNLHRWKVVGINFASREAAMNIPGWPVFRESAPILETFGVKLLSRRQQDGVMEEGWPPTLFKDDAPNLTHLSQYSFPLSFHSALLKNLKSWEIHSLQGSRASSVLGALMQATGLETLVFGRVSLTHDGTDHPMVELAKLKEFAGVARGDEAGWAFLLNHIVMPKCEKVRLTGDYWEMWSELDRDPAKGTIYAAIRRLVAVAGSLKLLFNFPDEPTEAASVRLVIALDNNTLDIQAFTAGQETITEALPFILREFELASRPQVVSSRITAGISVTFTAEVFHAFLWSLSELPELEFYTPSTSLVKTLFDCLAKPITGTSPPSWRLPDLERLTLGGDASFDLPQVRSFLEDRFGQEFWAMQGPVVEDNAVRPKRFQILKCLELREDEWRKEDRSALRRMLGKEVAKLGIVGRQDSDSESGSEDEEEDEDEDEDEEGSNDEAGENDVGTEEGAMTVES